MKELDKVIPTIQKYDPHIETGADGLRTVTFRFYGQLVVIEETGENWSELQNLLQTTIGKKYYGLQSAAAVIETIVMA